METFIAITKAIGYSLLITVVFCAVAGFILVKLNDKLGKPPEGI